MIPKPAKHFLKRSRAVTIGAWVAKDRMFGVRARLRPRESARIGARHVGWSLADSLAYIDWVLGDYRTYARLDPDRIRGASVLEVGPGDNFGIALELIGDGAERVVCLDRFVTWRDSGQQAEIYRAQIDRATGERRERMRAALVSGSADEFDPARIEVIEGVAIEDADTALDDGFDVIISRAVLAHLWDLDRGLERMDRMLRDGGLMAHKIDLSDHGLLTDGGHHALEFLTISDRVWDRMRRNTGLTNRRLADSYRDWFAARGYEADLLATRVCGDEGELDPFHTPLGADELQRGARRVEQIRERLLPRYRELGDEDLATAGLFAVARRKSSS